MIDRLCEAFGFDKHLVMDDGSGERHFSCRNPEGHLWNVGSHDT